MKLTVLISAAVILFTVTAYCAAQFISGGDGAYKFAAIVAGVFGVYAALAACFTKLAPSTDPENAEWMNDIK